MPSTGRHVINEILPLEFILCIIATLRVNVEQWVRRTMGLFLGVWNEN